MMKYIRHKTLGFILFEPAVRHDEVANNLGGPAQVTSAGFVFAPELIARCIGHSTSLDIGSSPTDGDDLRARMRP